jgi:hypothetical protein
MATLFHETVGQGPCTYYYSVAMSIRTSGMTMTQISSAKLGAGLGLLGSGVFLVIESIRKL